MLVVSAMARPGQELAEAHRPQLPAQGLLGNPDAVLGAPPTAAGCVTEGCQLSLRVIAGHCLRTHN
jgi:hypothetical protein